MSWQTTSFWWSAPQIHSEHAFFPPVTCTTSFLTPRHSTYLLHCFGFQSSCILDLNLTNPNTNPTIWVAKYKLTQVPVSWMLATETHYCPPVMTETHTWIPAMLLVSLLHPPLINATIFGLDYISLRSYQHNKQSKTSINAWKSLIKKVK